MKVDKVEIKTDDPERLKEVGERLTKGLIESGFKSDIETIGLLQDILFATGADPVQIQKDHDSKSENNP